MCQLKRMMILQPRYLYPSSVFRFVRSNLIGGHPATNDARKALMRSVFVKTFIITAVCFASLAH